MSERLRLLLALALAAAIRIPFWAEALRTPLDGDAAILGLMARHPFASATLWGQPYGSPVEAWLVAPFVAALGPTTAAVRIPGFLLGLFLVPLAFLLGRALDPRAGAPAALLAACPSSYVLLLSAVPPPLYPTALVLASALLVLALGLGHALATGAAARGRLLLWGALAGVALWTHLMTTGVILACVVFLLARARQGRSRLLLLLAALTLASAPWWWRVVSDPAAIHALGLRPSLAASSRHAAEVAPQLHEPLLGLLGVQAPWLADVAAPVARTPAWAAWPLILLQGVLFATACGALRKSRVAWLPFAAVLLTVAAFPLSRRAGPSDLRFLTPLYLPALALLAWALVRNLRTALAYAVVALIAALNLTGGARLLADWSSADRAAAPFHLPDLAPIQRLLAGRGIRRAYASYGPAYRLTYESGEALIVSQFRNERFPDQPLPYLDEVRFASRVAWILTAGIPSDMPTPTAFENDLRVAGGSWRRHAVGPAVVFHDFVPPFSPRVVPLASAGRAGDGDLTTGVVQTGSSGVTFDVTPPRALDAVTLLAPFGSARLPRSFDVEVSADMAEFRSVARRRRQREQLDLVWFGGQPQYMLDASMLAVPLDGRSVAGLRLVPVGEVTSWALGEILLHPPEPGPRSAWDEDPLAEASWPERRALLAARPFKERADWYSRSLIAARHH